MTDWKALEDAEDHAYFMAELMDISPESFTIEEKKQILHDMIASSSAIENAMRDEFAELDEVTQTRLIDDLAADGPRSREWWYEVLVDGPRHRDFPTLSDGSRRRRCVPSSKNRQIRLSNFDTLMLTASGRAGAVAAGPPAA